MFPRGRKLRPLFVLALFTGCDVSAIGGPGAGAGTEPCDPLGMEEPCGVDTGACEAGARICGTDGTWSECAGERPPEVEICDGLDNDCDDATDEELSPPTGTCLTAGVCASAEATCGAGVWTCAYAGTYEPSTEVTCDGLDNDCDGQVDEALTGPADICPSLNLGVCASGLAPACTGGEWICTFPADYETDESLCDGRDNDCDGRTDEDLVPAVSLCPNRDDGVCASGLVTACVAGSWACDYPPGYESYETHCDGLDNDCDGVVDENVILPPGQCKRIGICLTGVTAACNDGEWNCSYPPGYEPNEISCDGLDNDCDGTTDEDLSRSPLGLCRTAGVCAAVTVGCVNGAWACNYPASYEPAGETTCDGQDNDCDGVRDEDLADAPPGTCATAGICAYAIAACENGAWTCGYPAGHEAPDETTCDGLDNDCDGEADEGLLNRCGDCSPPDGLLVELCVNGLDDDCDGEIDENCQCDPGCQCDDPEAGAYCACNPPTNQPCYSGQPGTLGFGLCRGGLHDCEEQPDGSFAWGSCEGELIPQLECEVGVADGLDNDCDGAIDEGCLPDSDGDQYRPPEDCDDSDTAVHPDASEVCNGRDDDCDGTVDEGVTNICGNCDDVPAEVCDDGLDNNCDGEVDEGCGGCSDGETRPCYTGPAATVGIGSCAWGQQDCYGGVWLTSCVGEVLPEPEVCDGADNDCDDEIDERWAVGANICGWCDGTEVCDGIDNDCDALVDEGLRNPCGDCLPVPEETVCNGLDDDCDGTVDENLLTACGTCPDVACYAESWNDPSDCDLAQRDCQGLETDPEDADAVTLGQGTVTTPFIYIAVTGRDQVAKLETEWGEKIWQVSSHGDAPSRTAVALDYSVWVGNRGFTSNWDPASSNLVHLDADGNLICRTDAVGICRGVAIDGAGNVWAGTYNGRKLYKVHGQEVNDTDCTSPPCCRLLDEFDIGVAVYGLAVDGNGYLWTASNPTKKVDVATSTVVASISHSYFYGIAVDPDNNVWFGGWTGGGYINRVKATDATVWFTAVNNVTAVTVDGDGYIWGSRYGSNTVVKLDPTTGGILCEMGTPAGTNPHGVAVDALGKIWVPNRYGGYVNRFFPDCTHDATFEVDAGYELYTYSDMTGMQLRTVTTREAHWIQNFDSGYADPYWHSAAWQATTPPSTSVELTFISAETEAELITNPSPTCGSFTVPPADLLACPSLQGRRWLSADIRLTTSQDGIRPSFGGLEVFWSY